MSSSTAHLARGKIFIAEVDSPLGYHIVEGLRQDHELLEGHSYIVGSHSQHQSIAPHPSVHRVIDGKRQMTLLAKCVLDSDVVIVNLRGNKNLETEYIVELLNQRAQNEPSLVVIGIGSHMTWAHMNRKIEIGSGDKETHLGRMLSLKSSQGSTEKLKELDEIPQEKTVSDQKKRCPHYQWSWNYDQEQKIMALNAKNNVQAFVLTTGLIYGKDFPCSTLSSLLTQACFNEELTCFGDGSNILPTTYIGHLVSCIQQIVGNKNMDKMNVKLVVDDGSVTQLQIIQTIKAMAGNLKPINFAQRKYITKQENLMACSVALRTELFGKSAINFASYLAEKSQEIAQYLEFKSIRVYVQFPKIVVPTNPPQKTLSQNKSPQLSQSQNSGHQEKIDELKEIFNQNYIRVIEEEQFQIHNDVEHSEPAEQTNKQKTETTVKKFVIKNPLMSFLFVLEEGTLSEEFCQENNIQRFNILQFEAEKNKILDEYGLVYHKAQNEAEGGEINEENQQNSNILENEAVMKEQGQNYDKKVEMEIDKIDSSNSITLPRQLAEGKPTQKEENKYATGALKLDQYMLDNVLAYVSEAFVKLAGANTRRPVLSDFVGKLKEIYVRQMALKEEIALAL